MSLMEVNEASCVIQEAAHEDANIIFGAVVDPNLDGQGEDHGDRHRLRSQGRSARHVAGRGDADAGRSARATPRTCARAERRGSAAERRRAGDAARRHGVDGRRRPRRRRRFDGDAGAPARRADAAARRADGGRARRAVGASTGPAIRRRSPLDVPAFLRRHELASGRRRLGDTSVDPRDARAPAARSRTSVARAQRRSRSAHGVSERSSPMKSWQQRERARELLSKEVGYVRKPHGGRLRVALAFPNTYFVGMSNLGFQTVYKLFNAEDDIVCERVFLPPKTRAGRAAARPARRSSRSNRRRRSATSTSSRSRCRSSGTTPTSLTMLRLAGHPAARRPIARTTIRWSMIGGAVTFVNPEPLALFADVIAAGEGEALIPSLLTRVQGASDRDDLLRRLVAASAGSTSRRSTTCSTRPTARSTAFVPREGTGAPPIVKKAALKTTEAVDPPATTIFTPDTEFGSRFLVEVVRGCANLCRFCWAGYNYLPVRAFPKDRILRAGRAARAALESRRPGVDRAVRPPGHRGDPHAPGRDGLLDQPRVAAARRPDADDPPPAARRAASGRSRSRRRPAPIGCAA